MSYSVDYEQYPGLVDVEYYDVTLGPGDCLFVPYKWYAHNCTCFIYFGYKQVRLSEYCINIYSRVNTMHKFGCQLLRTKIRH